MKYLTTAIFLLVGVINFIPVFGAISAGNLERIYGVGGVGPELEILLRHRAVLFGLLGAFIIASAFMPSLQLIACGAGLVSMLAFVAIALATGGYGEQIRNVIAIDVGASVGLLLALALRQRAPG